MSDLALTGESSLDVKRKPGRPFKVQPIAKEPEVTPQVLPLTPIEAYIARMTDLKKAIDDAPYKRR